MMAYSQSQHAGMMQPRSGSRQTRCDHARSSSGLSTLPLGRNSWDAMTDALVPLQWIDLFHCDDPRDAVHQAVACLAQGGLIGLATETVYTVAASALHEHGLRPAACAGPDSRFRAADTAGQGARGMRGLGAGHRSDRASAGPEALAWSSHLDFPWGTLREPFRTPAGLKAQKLIAPAGALALRCSADPFLRGVLQLTSAPLVLGPASPPEGPAAVTAGSLRGFSVLDMVIDSGPTHGGRELYACSDRKGSLDNRA